MQFIIDKDIYFRPADGAIWHIDTENEKTFNAHQQPITDLFN